MPKRSLIEQLNEAVQAMLVRPDAERVRGPFADPRLAPLLRIARELRELPHEDFKARLKSDLERRAAMASATPGGGEVPTKEESKKPGYIPEGYHTLTPYMLVAGAAEFIEFLKEAFGGTERLRVPAPGDKIMHAEVAVGDSMIELSDGNEQNPPSPTAIHLYVTDADSKYKRAIQAGATSLREMADQPYGDREGSVKDKFGNHWYIGTPKGWTPGQPLRVVPYLHLRGAEKMLPFLQQAFGAEVSGEVARSPEGTVVHGTIRLGDAALELGEAHAEFQPMPCHLHLYVPDVDATYEQALRAGATSISPPEDKPYGERGAGVRDPFGNSWFIATYGKGLL